LVFSARSFLVKNYALARTVEFMNKTPVIFHIAAKTDVPNNKIFSEYRCDSLATEGFIHCCEAHQLSGVVSRYYQDNDDVVLLELDVDKLEPALIRENTVGGSELFPHLYGPINAEAVIAVIPFGLRSNERVGMTL